jgi:hypothetical protein
VRERRRRAPLQAAHSRRLLQSLERSAFAAEARKKPGAWKLLELQPRRLAGLTRDSHLNRAPRAVPLLKERPQGAHPRSEQNPQAGAWPPLDRRAAWLQWPGPAAEALQQFWVPAGAEERSAGEPGAA